MRIGWKAKRNWHENYHRIYCCEANGRKKLESPFRIHKLPTIAMRLKSTRRCSTIDVSTECLNNWFSVVIPRILLRPTTQKNPHPRRSNNVVPQSDLAGDKLLWHFALALCLHLVQSYHWALRTSIGIGLTLNVERKKKNQKFSLFRWRLLRRVCASHNNEAKWWQRKLNSLTRKLIIQKMRRAASRGEHCLRQGELRTQKRFLLIN